VTKEVICPNCGVEFSVILIKRTGRQKSVYCSRECSFEARRNRTDVFEHNCVVCGKGFTSYNKNAKMCHGLNCSLKIRESVTSGLNAQGVFSKRCGRCDEHKPLECFCIQFSAESGNRFIFSSYCKQCKKMWHDQRRRSHHAIALESERKSRFRDCYNVGEYTKIVESQDGMCAICGVGHVAKHKSGHRKKVTNFCVDHDHVTGKIRGILCHRCNIVLGQACDDPDFLVKCAEYLRKHQSPPVVDSSKGGNGHAD
jgi:hypothetical protein